jgi:hypothetical protein
LHPTETLSLAEQEIKAHTERLMLRRPSCPFEQCPRCKGYPGGFTLHAYANRFFRVIVAGFVRTIASYLVRWKCPLCRRTFREYPRFAAPYKRFVLSTSPPSPSLHPSSSLLERADRYLHDDRISYREAVSAKGLPIAVQRVSRDGKTRIENSALSHVTLWRFVGFLGRREELARHAAARVRERDPASPLFRRLPLLRAAPKKYRSDARRRLLESGLRLFAALAEFTRLFAATIFHPLRNTLFLHPP